MKPMFHVAFALLVTVTLTSLTGCSANCTAPNGNPPSNRVVDATEPELAKALASVELVRKGLVETTTPEPGVKISSALFMVKDSAKLEVGVASLFERGILKTTCTLTCTIPDSGSCSTSGCKVSDGGCSSPSCGGCSGTCVKETTNQRQ